VSGPWPSGWPRTGKLPSDVPRGTAQNKKKEKKKTGKLSMGRRPYFALACIYLPMPWPRRYGPAVPLDSADCKHKRCTSCRLPSAMSS